MTKLIPTVVCSTIRRFEQVIEDRDVAIKEFLRRMGWQATCDTPGSLWLWEKKLPDGRVALVNESTAVWFERSWAEKVVEAHVDGIEEPQLMTDEEASRW